ncbi:hypothetical protein IB277_06750 [Ensifer sp. ENS07]|uniref:hypothetical protein n=1 Tax=Ensifer sp. ENS07 TaxID=2769274 RepID=UPI0017805DDF|nr:hypothetical protein [Ensifer sp. ENS07]MBD9635991.1 hypothetical protein [Ensifer sp. ENS07]
MNTHDDYQPLESALARIGMGRKWYYNHRHHPGFPAGKNVHGRIYVKVSALFAYIDSCPDNVPEPLPPVTGKRRPGRPRKIPIEAAE